MRQLAAIALLVLSGAAQAESIRPFTVRVTDETCRPAAGATVGLRYDGDTADRNTFITDAMGKVEFARESAAMMFLSAKKADGNLFGQSVAMADMETHIVLHPFPKLQPGKTDTGWKKADASTQNTCYSGEN